MTPRVLFIDDETALLDMIRRRILSQGEDIAADFAASGTEALSLLGQRDYDVVISDMLMPGMDGSSLLTQVARKHPQTARLILTGQFDPARSLEYARMAHQLLLKPAPVSEILATVRNLSQLRTVLTDKALSELVGRLVSLPVAPDIYRRMTSALGNEKVSLDDVGAIVASDPALSASILRLCNSAFFGLSHKVSSPADAVRFMGTQTLKAFVLFHELFHSMDPRNSSLFEIDVLWAHCVRTAGFARCIVHKERGDAAQAESSFLAGLLHDIGMLVLAENFPDDYHALRTWAAQAGAPLHEAERREFGACHAEVGAFVMGLWGLPAEAAWAVAYHHEPMRRVESGCSLLVALHAADALDHELRPASGAKAHMDMAYLALTGCLERLPAWRETCAATLREDTE